MTKVKYWIVYNDIEQWTGNLVEEWIPLEHAKNETEAIREAEKWLEANRKKVYYFESGARVDVVKRIKIYIPK